MVFCAALLDLTQEIVGESTGADDHKGFDAAVVLAFAVAAEKVQDLGAGAADVNDVAGLEAEIPLWDDGLAIALNDDDEDVLLELVLKFCEGLADEGMILRQRIFDDVDAPAHEGFDARCRWKAQEAGDLTGRFALRIDDGVDADAFLDEALVRGVFVLADAGDGVFGAHLLGEDAGDDVDLVLRGDGDENVGVGGVGALQGVDVNAAGGDAGDVCGVDEAFELVGVLFDDDDVVLVGEFLADDAADLADANDNDMHG